MQTYAEFRPTGFDVRGLRAATMGNDPDDADRRAWLVAPCGQNRDSDALSRSNFRTLENRFMAVDPEGVDHENHRFGHWACGWFELLVVRPGSVCETIAAEAATALESYPALDEDDWSALEAEEEEEE